MDKEQMIELIKEYVFEEKEFCLSNCDECMYLDECYAKACSRCDSEFAKSINFGGYNSEEEFWEMLMS